MNNKLPFNALSNSSAPFKPTARLLVSMWERSAATPGVCTISYNDNSVTSGFNFNNKDKGCPIPPDAPQTATL